MQDVQSLRSVRRLLEVIADSGLDIAEVDYDGTLWLVYFTTDSRVVVIEFSRLSSLANVRMIEADVELTSKFVFNARIDDVSLKSPKATPATMRRAFAWLGASQVAHVDV